MRRDRGDHQAARLEADTRALEIRERLATADPNHTDYQNNLTVSLEKMGNMLLTRGDPNAALQAHTRALEIRERLATADPNNTLYQRNLTMSLNNVGNMWLERGDPEGALQAYIRVLEIRERLAAADPNNTQYQRDLFEYTHYALETGDARMAMRRTPCRPTRDRFRSLRGWPTRILTTRNTGATWGLVPIMRRWCSTRRVMPRRSIIG